MPIEIETVKEGMQTLDFFADVIALTCLCGLLLIGTIVVMVGLKLEKGNLEESDHNERS